VYDGITTKCYQNYDAVGADLEASNPPSDPNDAGPHNMGHGVFATPPYDPNHMFVMGVPEVAMTTPVFYRWHRASSDTQTGHHPHAAKRDRRHHDPDFDLDAPGARPPSAAPNSTRPPTPHSTWPNWSPTSQTTRTSKVYRC
jgi:hypothetical protein